MKAIILAGGRGERLMPLTAQRPKCMVELNGRPIASYQLDWLAREGVDEVIFSCGYRWEVIEQFFEHSTRPQISVRYAPETEPLGRGGGLRNALEHLRPLSEPIAALNGDLVTDAPLNDMVRKHGADGAIATLLLVPYVSHQGIVDLDKDGNIIGFREKPRLPYWISGGVYVLSPEIYDLLPERGDHEDTTWPHLASEGKLLAYPFEGFWQGIDSVKDVASAEQALRARP